MLTNEQRAHDLTIATLQYILNNPLITSDLEGFESVIDGKASRDLFKMYVDLYHRTLESMTREFSNNL